MTARPAKLPFVKEAKADRTKLEQWTSPGQSVQMLSAIHRLTLASAGSDHRLQTLLRMWSGLSAFDMIQNFTTHHNTDTSNYRLPPKHQQSSPNFPMLNSFHYLRWVCERRNTSHLDEVISTHPFEESTAPVLDTSTLALRYRAYGILYCAGIPLCVWFEDALEHVGVPTETFCLYLLVPAAQLQQAADHLVNDRHYTKRRLPLALDDISQFENIYAPPARESYAPPSAVVFSDNTEYVPDPDDIADSLNPPVILLPAEEWSYELPRTAAEMSDCYSTLPQLLTSLMLKWLTLGDDEWRLSLHVAVMIEYVYNLVEDVKKPGFEDLLPPKIRRFHSDLVHGRDPGEDQKGIWKCQKYYRDER